MEIKHFETFYKKGLYIAKQSCQNVNSSKQAIEYARKAFSKTDLNSFYNIGVLSKKLQLILNTKTVLIKFSIDSIVKNIIKHPEISFEEYLYLDIILKNPDKIAISKTSNNSVLLLKHKEKYYQAVLKATIDKTENYLTSFRLLNETEFSKL